LGWPLKIKLPGFVKKIFIAIGNIPGLITKVIDVKEIFPLDTRDFCVFGGLAAVTYGLYSFEPWVGFSSAGAIAMVIGLFFGRSVKK